MLASIAWLCIWNSNWYTRSGCINPSEYKRNTWRLTFIDSHKQLIILAWIFLFFPGIVRFKAVNKRKTHFLIKLKQNTQKWRSFDNEAMFRLVARVRSSLGSNLYVHTFYQTARACSKNILLFERNNNLFEHQVWTQP